MDISFLAFIVFRSLIDAFRSLGALEQIFILAVISCALVASIDAWRNRYTVGLKIAKGGGHGTVYVLQDTSSPAVFKVGFTRRNAARRLAEVERDMTRNRSLKLVMTLESPHARTIEAVVHRRLARHRIKSRKWRGREWFRVRGFRQHAYLQKNLLQSATDVQRKARRYGRWPKRSEPRFKPA